MMAVRIYPSPKYISYCIYIYVCVCVWIYIYVIKYDIFSKDQTLYFKSSNFF